MKCCTGPLHTCTHTNTRTLTRSRAESLHISSHSHHSAEKSPVSQTLLFLQRPVATQSACCFQASWTSARIPFPPLSLTHSLSFLLSPFFLFLLLTLSPAVLSDLPPPPLPCPVSAQCTSIIQRQSTGLSGLSNQSWARH